MTIRTHDRLAAFAAEFTLSVGNHASPEDGLCAMELVAFLDGAPHSVTRSSTLRITGECLMWRTPVATAVRTRSPRDAAPVRG